MKFLNHITLPLLAIASLTLAALDVQAADFKAKSAQKHRHAHSRDVTHTGPNGSRTKHVEQTPTEDGYSRTTTVTNGKGETATKTTTGSYDPVTNSWTKTSARTHFDGSTSGKTSTAARTEDGYARETVKTNRKGGTMTRSVDASYDKDTRSLNKTISIDKTKAADGAGE